MNPEETIRDLLVRMSAGDSQAAQQVFQTYEPYLRMVVRRRLSSSVQAKFDSVDIVQSVWADLLPDLQSGRWEFTTPEHFRSFLVRVTRNRLVDRVRQHHRPTQFEQSLEVSQHQEIPDSRTAVGGELEADEMWEHLKKLCPPQHASIIELKRGGLSTREIASEVGLHEGSVRRILAELASRLALQTSTDFGGRGKPGDC